MSNGSDKQNGQGVRRGDRQTRHLAQSVILEEAGSSGLIRIAIITVSVIICFFVVWAAVTYVDEVAITSGEIIPTGRVQTIQHLEGGIIAEILVKDGAIVKEGESLMRLDPAAAYGELTQQRARLITLDLQTERLRAVGEGREPDFSFAGPEYEKLVNDQIRIYRSSLDAGVNRRSVLQDQINQRQAELAIFREEEETLLRNLQILEEEYAMREALYAKGLSSKMVYLDVQRDLNDAIGDLAKLTSERKKTAEALGESHNRLLEVETDLREIAMGEMGDLMGERASLRESTIRSEDRVRRLDILSPVHGIIKGLEANTIGGVIPPGGVLMQIVPLDEELIIETRITPRDVGHVKTGQPVTVKVTTFDFARYGGIDGTLFEVSATTFLDENGEPYYRGLVNLSQNHVGIDDTVNLVLPGMTVQADIKTGKKTLLEYLLKPVVSSVNESFRER
ncbi:MAG: HlyD family type I secretion periplasmic adaptor subunit [Rhodospirillales bacterium]|nr:HlyD family type I secretion periplasmic adaptor subunit [Rhodospirillales bacterium]